MKKAATVLIVAVTSDIGYALATRYVRDGYNVVGTYRPGRLTRRVRENKLITAYECDVAEPNSVRGFARRVLQDGLTWDTYISAVGMPLPLLPYFESDFEEWNRSFYTNAAGQLHLLHAVYTLRNQRAAYTNAVFFAGGGVNGAVKNFSAYTLGKVALIKMCEFLYAENPDLNVFAIGPGWTKTKTHNFILENLNPKDARYEQTRHFMTHEKGTSLDDIYRCIWWACAAGPEVTSGRNFSVVHDAWKEQSGVVLRQHLESDPDMYTLRRKRNNFHP